MQILLILATLLACACLSAAAEEEPQEELVAFDRLWDFSKPDETEQRFRELLPRAQASGDLDYHLQLLTQIARTEGLQGRFDDAHATLDRVEAKLERAQPATRMRYLLERGRAFNSSKKPEEARSLFLEAWSYGTREKVDYHALDAAHMLEIVERKELKLAWSERAMKLAETSEDARCKLWLGSLYNNTGWTLYYLGRHEEALALHEKCRDWHAERENVEPALISRWAVAKCLRALKRYEEALAILREVLEERTRLALPAGFTHEELAENLLALGRPDEARPHFVAAWALLKDLGWIDEDEPGRSARLRQLAGAEEEGGGGAE